MRSAFRTKLKIMKTAVKVLIDELLEQGHVEEVENVIFWALQDYAEKNKGFNSGAVAYAISQRMIESEKEENPAIMNYEAIDSLADA